MKLLWELARDKEVEICQNLDNVALVNVLQRALRIVLPSVYTDVFGQYSAIPELLGLALLEGMACELPALATNVGGMPEIVEDGVSGFLVPPNDSGVLRDRIKWL